jgi:hypothetical protein
MSYLEKMDLWLASRLGFKRQSTPRTREALVRVLASVASFVCLLLAFVAIFIGLSVRVARDEDEKAKTQEACDSKQGFLVRDATHRLVCVPTMPCVPSARKP